MAESLNSQLKKYSVEQLNTIKAEAEREILERSKSNRACVINQIIVLCKEYGICASDLFDNIIEQPVEQQIIELLPLQSPVEQAQEVLKQGREYIKQKQAEFASTNSTSNNKSVLNFYEVDEVKNDADTAKPDVLSMLRAKIAAAASKRNLVTHIDSAQQQQLQCLSTYILKVIETGKMTSRELKAVLTDEDYDNYLSRCDEPSPAKIYAAGVPSFFDNYKDLVSEGDFQNTQASSLAKKRNLTYKNGRSSASNTRYKAESYYEKAIECLQEISMTNDWYEAQLWLDRDVDFTHGFEPSACAMGVPRLRNSKSQYAQQTMPKTDTYLQNRLAALETLCYAIETIIYASDVDYSTSSTEQSKALRDLINNIDDDLDF